MKNCFICGRPMDPWLTQQGHNTHPTCPMFAEPGNEDPFTLMLKSQLIEIILWGEDQNPRGHQVLIGPSEIGDVCDRRIGYRIAGVEPCNTEFDPWPSIMGTAVHSWLQDTVNKWVEKEGQTDWFTEATLNINDFVEGHSDLYWVKHHTVIDWKTAGPDVLKKIRAEGPPPGYVIQAHMYGYGFEQTGMPVKKVALAFLGRAGWLKDMYLWVADYDRSIAENAMGRLYRIANKVVTMDVLNQSHRWEQIEATPSNSCGFCNWYAPGKDSETGADATGCPGR